MKKIKLCVLYDVNNYYNFQGNWLPGRFDLLLGVLLLREMFPFGYTLFPLKLVRGFSSKCALSKFCFINTISTISKTPLNKIRIIVGPSPKKLPVPINLKVS